MNQMDGTERIYMGKGVPREHWARFAWLSEHGKDVQDMTRRERAMLGLQEQVEMVL